MFTNIKIFTNLTSEVDFFFQMELQKDYDTVQNMLEEKEQEIESLTREYLETRSQPDGSDVAVSSLGFSSSPF